MITVAHVITGLGQGGAEMMLLKLLQQTDRSQFSVLVATVILSAIVPTVVAQRFFSPPVHELTTEEIGLVEDEEFEPARSTLGS